VKLPIEAANTLQVFQKGTGKSMAGIIADFLAEEPRFRSDVEHWLADEAAKRGVNRQTMIEIFVFEAVSLALCSQ